MADTEREAFEKAMNDSRFFPRELDFSRTKSPSGRDEYANSHLQSNWEGWQARAALASRPAEVDESPMPPKTPEQIVAFIGNHYDSMEDLDDVPDIRFTLSVHDLMSAMYEWFEHYEIEAAPSHTTNKEK